MPLRHYLWGLLPDGGLGRGVEVVGGIVLLVHQPDLAVDSKALTCALFATLRTKRAGRWRSSSVALYQPGQGRTQSEPANAGAGPPAATTCASIAACSTLRAERCLKGFGHLKGRAELECLKGLFETRI